jgi:hypothetical protein
MGITSLLEKEREAISRRSVVEIRFRESLGSNLLLPLIPSCVDSANDTVFLHRCNQILGYTRFQNAFFVMMRPLLDFMFSYY